jgi:arabinogalactan oligomer/maltooligosaccharide transport system substrate-binding protein
MKNYRWTSALVALALILSACGTTGASPTAGGASPTSAATGAEPTEGGESPEPTEGGGPITGLAGELELWHSYSSGAGTELQALEEALARVEGANPDLDVTVTEVPFDQLFNKINTAWAAGEPKPDLFIAPNDSLGFQAREELLADLSEYESQLQDISATATDGSKVEGTLYEIPESLKAVALYYNKDTVATPPATTDELLSAVESGDLKLALFEGSGGLYHNFGWWGAFGGELMDDTGKCIADQGGVADAFQYLVDLKDAGAALQANYDDMANGFKAGDYDAIVDGPWALGGYRDAVANLGVAPMPEGPDGPSLPLLGVDGFYVNASADDIDLAARFGLAMTDAGSQEIFANTGGHIPANTTVPIDDEHTKAFADAFADTFPRPQVKALDNFWGPFGDAQAKVTETGADPTQEVATACGAMNEANGL